jgi:hypothetical protein
MELLQELLKFQGVINMKNFLLLLFLTIFSLSSFAASNRVLDADQIDGQKQQQLHFQAWEVLSLLFLL